MSLLKNLMAKVFGEILVVVCILLGLVQLFEISFRILKLLCSICCYHCYQTATNFWVFRLLCFQICGRDSRFLSFFDNCRTSMYGDV